MGILCEQCKWVFEGLLESFDMAPPFPFKLLVSPLITPVILPYITPPYTTPFKGFKLKLIWVLLKASSNLQASWRICSYTDPKYFLPSRVSENILKLQASK